MERIKTILFDLDGTLLPMNLDKFIEIYFNEMGKHFQNIISPNELVRFISKSTEVMVQNTEPKTNKEVFWRFFDDNFGNEINLSKDMFEDFYNKGYLKAQKATNKSLHMIESVKMLKSLGYEVVVATNPLFPKKAIYDRVKWAGFVPEDFIYISSYEDNHFCKPQPAFYQEVLEKINRKPEECMMVGNDVQEDMLAGKLGFKTWLITDCLINRSKELPKVDYQGSAEEFHSFVKSLT